MRYVILGTAGHIDHGKSALVKALTGVDPDRLKEEKERGITIDIGFAEMEFPEDELSIGIVDVPGHERLIRNMLAGAGGIDMVVLVIAADEGIMPQSREHLHICNLLRIKTGLVAITKADLVEPDWLELVGEEVSGFVKGTFLEGARVVPVSSKTGQNLDALKEAIRETALGTEPKPTGGIFRLPIDRVFTLKGFGTVVTGTAVSGSVSVGEQLEVLPSGLTGKVRGLHSHGRAVETAYAGQRVAVNLQGVDKDDLARGDTLVAPGRFTPALEVDARVELLDDSPPLKSRGLVHFHMGTSETLARVVLYGADQLGPGESAYCQFRLRDRVVAQGGDRFIIRRYSPLQTMGGGEVLDPSPLKRKKKDGTGDLEVYEGGELREMIAVKVGKSGLGGMSIPALEGWVRAGAGDIRSSVDSLKSKGVLVDLEGTLVHRDAVGSFSERLVGLLRDFHVKYPMKQGLPKEEARVRLRVPQKVFSLLLGSVPEVAAEKDLLRLGEFRAAASEEEKTRLLGLLEQKGFNTPTVSEFSAELGMKEKELSDIMKLMLNEGTVMRINDSMYMSATVHERMIGLLREQFSRKPEMTVAEFRDMLGTTRKYALPLIEYLDASKITIRVGDVRKLMLK